MSYYLAKKLSTYRSDVVVVGCGGTGGFVAEGLCRLLATQREGWLVLIDHDRVEEPNLARQNFYREDLGRFKAEALAERLARKFGRPVGYVLDAVARGSWPYQILLQQAALVIGCVDNPMARQAIAAHVGPDMWWIDAGNGRDFGQVLVGNSHVTMLEGAFDPQKGVCHALPLPTLVQPDLLAAESRPVGTDCAQAVAAGEQSPTINQAMAALVLEVVRRLIEGTCPWWQVYLDLGAGAMRTVEATPEAVARLTGVNVQKLIKTQSERR